MSHPPAGYPGQFQPGQGYPGQGFPQPGGAGYPAPGGGLPQHHTPSPQPQGTTTIDTNGAFEGVQYRIDHRDSNSLLGLRLQPGYVIKGKPGSMVAMDPTVKLKGKVRVCSSAIIDVYWIDHIFTAEVQLQKARFRWRSKS